MRVAVIGAGWAGLSAAVTAFDRGHDVTVFEASHTLGGRARSVHSRRLGADIDNGQHIMLGAYDETLALIERLGGDTKTSLLRRRLKLESIDGSFLLRVGSTPSPLNLLLALVGSQGLSPRDKWSLLRAMRRLQNNSWVVSPDITVQQWLDVNRQPLTLRRLFWIPLCIAAMNTPVDLACAQLFANVLRDSLGGSAGACDMVLPRVDLSSLWPERVACLEGGPGRITIRRGAVVKSVAVGPAQNAATIQTGVAGTGSSGNAVINGEPFDAAILACNAPSVLRLLQPLQGGDSATVEQLRRTLSSFSYVPIATVTLELEERWELPESMYLLLENRDASHYGQWLFNCPAFMNQETAPAKRNFAHIVISDAEAAIAGGEARLISAITTQLRTQAQRFGPMPAVKGHHLIVEKRATFAAVPGLRRPQASTPWPGLWLAGDWTDTGYPAVLEGAVRSGRRAAEALHRALN